MRSLGIDLALKCFVSSRFRSGYVLQCNNNDYRVSGLLPCLKCCDDLITVSDQSLCLAYDVVPTFTVLGNRRHLFTSFRDLKG